MRVSKRVRAFVQQQIGALSQLELLEPSPPQTVPAAELARLEGTLLDGIDLPLAVRARIVERAYAAGARAR